MLDCTKQFAKLIRGSEATKIHDDNHAIMLVFAFGFNTSTENPVTEKPVTEKSVIELTEKPVTHLELKNL